MRYPLSGLVGTPADKQATEAHNAQFPNSGTNVELLNQNIVAWLTSSIIGRRTRADDRAQKFADCLDAPNYTVFSNTTSAARVERSTPTRRSCRLESPHNNIHLAVGGFDVPNQGDVSPIDGANGDMGENDTAGLDPIFFFHHCYIDTCSGSGSSATTPHGARDHRRVPRHQLGDNQGPTPGVAPNSWLDVD